MGERTLALLTIEEAGALLRIGRTKAYAMAREWWASGGQSDSRALHRELKTAGMLYHAALRAELTARLGVAWDAVDRNGQADIAGIPAGLVEHWSSRRAAVVARAGERIAEAEVSLGRSLTPEERRRTFEVAALETRTAKTHDDGFAEGLHDRWAAEAAAVGHPAVSWLPDTVGRDTVDRDTVGRDTTVDAVVTDTLGELARTTSTWARTDVVRQVTRLAPTSLGGAEEVSCWVEHVTDRVLGDGAVVHLTAPTPPPPGDLCRRDGRSVYEPHGAPRYSTVATLTREQRVVDLVTAGRDAHRAVARETTVEDAITAAGLDDDQAAAVRHVTIGGDTVACVVGPAGTGKSRTMGAANQAWVACGTPVRGLAVSASSYATRRLSSPVFTGSTRVGSETPASTSATATQRWSPSTPTTGGSTEGTGPP